jgi:hypothetical protein
LQNENSNSANADSRESITLQAARKMQTQEKLHPTHIEPDRWEELREEDPERWDGLS